MLIIYQQKARSTSVDNQDQLKVTIDSVLITSSWILQKLKSICASAWWEFFSFAKQCEADCTQLKSSLIINKPQAHLGEESNSPLKV